MVNFIEDDEQNEKELQKQLKIDDFITSLRMRKIEEEIIRRKKYQMIKAKKKGKANGSQSAN